MRIDDLRRLLVIAEHDRITDAAAALQLPQPTISRLVARIEEEYGVHLFDRSPHGIRLNRYGDLAVAAARDIVQRHQQLRAELDNLLDPETGQVRLAFLDSMATSLVPSLLHDFRALAPRTRISLRQENGQDILADLETGASEVAITSPRPGGPHAWIPLQQQRLVAIVPPDHPLAARKRVRLEELTAQPFITVPSGFGFRALVTELFADIPGQLQVAFESTDLATIEGLVGAGLGVSVVPEHIAGATSTRAIAIAETHVQRSVGLTWRTDRDLSPAAERFVAFVRSR